MPNKNACKTCKKYWPLEKGLREGTKQLNRGYCLARTIFPKGRVGERVYPPRATVAETENDMVQAHIVRESDVVAHCEFYLSRRK
jgi:hypothetical protein